MDPELDIDMDEDEYEEMSDYDSHGDDEQSGELMAGPGATEEGSVDSDADATPSGRGSGFNPIGTIAGALNSLRPRQLLLRLRRQGKRLQHAVFRLEDVGRVGARAAVKLAFKAARPAAICLIVARTLRTIEAGNDPIMRMMRLPANKQMDYYYSRLLGADWQKQIEQDLAAALQEVEQGLITDDMVDEKRQLAAIMLRRLEVEEWDKERMRHFYYGLYGMGPWYWDMEERLHNPFFIGARAWNGPIEGWVGKNRVFARDMPHADSTDAMIAALEQARGAKISESAKAQLRARESPSHLDYVLGGRLFKEVVDPVGARETLEEARLVQQQQPAAV